MACKKDKSAGRVLSILWFAIKGELGDGEEMFSSRTSGSRNRSGYYQNYDDNDWDFDWDTGGTDWDSNW